MCPRKSKADEPPVCYPVILEIFAANFGLCGGENVGALIYECRPTLRQNVETSLQLRGEWRRFLFPRSMARWRRRRR